jgi:hypothetical protein
MGCFRIIGIMVKRDTAVKSIADSTSMAAMLTYWMPASDPRCCCRAQVLRRKCRRRSTMAIDRVTFNARERRRYGGVTLMVEDSHGELLGLADWMMSIIPKAFVNNN